MIRLPAEFVSSMKDMMGEEELAAFLSCYECEDSSALPRALRLNPLKTGGSFGRAGDLSGPVGAGEEGSGALRDFPDLSAFSPEPVPWAAPYGFYCGIGRADVRPGKSPLHDAGLYYMQEPSAMAPAALSGVRPGERVLDLCAAPGGKTTMLASMLGGEGLLVSNEIEPDRARILSQNVERMGIVNAVVTNESPERLAERFPAFFDRVIVDAPCSGEGMFRKEEQAVTTWSPEKVARCAQLQARILESAAGMVRGGGILVYSTCTFSPEEDERQTVSFLQSHPEFELVDLPALLGSERMREYGFEPGRPEWAENNAAQARRTIRLWPHRLRGEGHFVAVFRRAGEHAAELIPQGRGLDALYAGSGKPARGAGKGQSLAREEWTAIRCLIEENLTADIAARCAASCGADAVRFGDEIYLMPYAAQIPAAGLKILRPGLHLGTLKKGRFEPAHALAMALRPEETRRCMNLRSSCSGKQSGPAWGLSEDTEEGAEGRNLPGESPEAAAFLRGESLPCDPSLKGWTLIAFDGISAGWAKASGGMLKNHYPKGLRRPY